MKRRSALKQIGTGLSAGLILPWMASCKEDEIRPEIDYRGTVAIIGAGAAGLYAADYLLAKGINVVIYEASPRIGGRIRTLRPFDKTGPGLWFNQNAKLSSDFPIELGADRIFGDNSTWANFIRKEKFSTHPLDVETDNFYWLKDNLVDSQTALFDSDFEAAYSFIQNLSSASASPVSVQEAVTAAGISSEVYAILNARIGNKYGTSNTRLGISGLTEAIAMRTRNSNNLLLTNTSMADVLIEGFIKASERVQLNTIIKNINYENDKIQLSGERSINGAAQPFSMDFDKVIVTVPVSILKAGDITFTPDLPATKKTALSNIGMDTGLRVVIDFKRNFWGGDFKTIYGGVMAEYFNAGADRSTVGRTLTVTVSAEKAEELSGYGIDMIPFILDELDILFENQATANVRTDAVQDNYIAVIQDWGNEPFIKGSMSYLKPGTTINSRVTLAEPLEGKLFFAGEATDFSGEAGNVNGALISGERAAQELIQTII